MPKLLKGGSIGVIWESIIGVIEGDTRGLDCSSNDGFPNHPPDATTPRSPGLIKANQGGSKGSGRGTHD